MTQIIEISDFKVMNKNTKIYENSDKKKQKSKYEEICVCG